MKSSQKHQLIRQSCRHSRSFSFFFFKKKSSLATKVINPTLMICVTFNILVLCFFKLSGAEHRVMTLSLQVTSYHSLFLVKLLSSRLSFNSVRALSESCCVLSLLFFPVRMYPNLHLSYRGPGAFLTVT